MNNTIQKIENKMDDANRKMKHAVEQADAENRKIAGEAKDGLHAARAKAHDFAQHTNEAAQDKVNEAKHAAKAFAGRAHDKANVLAQDMKKMGEDIKKA